MSTAAAELRAAGARLRELAKAIDAPDLPNQSWHAEECADDDRGNCPCIVAQGVCNTDGPFVTPLYYVADTETPELAAYIVAMGPNVGVALADWLDSAAEDAEQIGADFRALAVARQINGGQP